MTELEFVALNFLEPYEACLYDDLVPVYGFATWVSCLLTDKPEEQGCYPVITY